MLCGHAVADEVDEEGLSVGLGAYFKASDKHKDVLIEILQVRALESELEERLHTRRNVEAREALTAHRGIAVVTGSVECSDYIL